jgi:hypothetical protein
MFKTLQIYGNIFCVLHYVYSWLWSAVVFVGYVKSWKYMFIILQIIIGSNG